MYGNVGEKWIQVKELHIGKLTLSDVGSEFVIGDYYSVPHGYASIKYDGVLLFIPDKMFSEHFVTLNDYNRYCRVGSIINLNANGTFGTYSVENIENDGDDENFVFLKLKKGCK